MSRREWAAVLGATLCLAAAADPAERLADPARENRARAIFRETRCLVCQGESIDDSDAPLAADLRHAIRQRLADGASDTEVRRFLVARYGEFVLFRPPVDLGNAALWFGPFLVAAAGLALLVFRERGRTSPEPALSAEDEARLALLEAGAATDSLKSPGVTRGSSA